MSNDIMTSLKYDEVAQPVLSPSSSTTLWEAKPQEFVFNNQESTYFGWDGDKLGSEMYAIDTETTLIQSPSEVPQLVIAQASGSDGENVVIHPDQLADFFNQHKEMEIVFFNAAFDIAVIEDHFEQHGHDEANDILQNIIRDGRCHDLMLLDQLVRLGAGEKGYRRSLAAVVRERLGVELEKEESPRNHFETLLEKDYQNIDPDFYEYAIRDSRATYDTFRQVYQEACQIEDDYENIGHIAQEMSEKWGPLTEQIQLRGAVALDNVSREGFQVDKDKLDALISSKKCDICEQVNAFLQCKTVQKFEEEENISIFKRGKTGEIKYTDTYTPRKSTKALRKMFSGLCNEKKMILPTTKKGNIALARDQYENTPVMEVSAVKRYFHIQDACSKLQKLMELQKCATEAGEIHSQYTTLVTTGRTASKDPNIQNLGRKGKARSCIQARPGHIFYDVDYSSVELRALASICHQRYGDSVLGKRLNEGVDPHTYTAAQILEKDEGDVTKHERQKAKIFNFGIPGGMRARTLAQQARDAYSISITEEEAEEWRELLISDVYPYIGEFLDEYLEPGVKMVFDVPAGLVVDSLVNSTEAGEWASEPQKWMLHAARRVVESGRKRSGEPYHENFVTGIWEGLAMALCAGDEIPIDSEGWRVVRDCRHGSEESQVLFPTQAVTPTGRVWSGVNYRQAHNAPFQGLAADGAKLALYELYRKEFTPIIFVHDEVVIEIPDDEHKQIKKEEIDDILIQQMRRVIPDVQITVEGEFMKRWRKI